MAAALTLTWEKEEDREVYMLEHKSCHLKGKLEKLDNYGDDLQFFKAP